MSPDAECTAGLTKCDTATGGCGCTDDDECCTLGGGTAGCGMKCNPMNACVCPDQAACDAAYTTMTTKCQ